MKTLLRNCTLVLADGCRQDAMEITDNRIAYIGPERPAFTADRVIDAAGRYVLPGFIDLHSNGIAGFDCCNGLYTSDGFSTQAEDYVRGMEQAAQAYAANGTTAVLLTSIASPFD